MGGCGLMGMRDIRRGIQIGVSVHWPLWRLLVRREALFDLVLFVCLSVCLSVCLGVSMVVAPRGEAML